MCMYHKLKWNFCDDRSWRNICVTDRTLVAGDFVTRIAEILKGTADGDGSAGLFEKPDALILREKDLTDDDYCKLAMQIQPLCKAAGAAFLVSGRMVLAEKLAIQLAADPERQPASSGHSGVDGVQLSFAAAQAWYTSCAGEHQETAPGAGRIDRPSALQLPFGVSVHSSEEAVQAEKFGASWLIYGHVFATDCKKGLAPRGLAALQEVCQKVNIPVYAIGGIDNRSLQLCLNAGAAGGCRMSGYMKR